jgi:hypothetical protein
MYIFLDIYQDLLCSRVIFCHMQRTCPCLQLTGNSRRVAARARTRTGSGSRRAAATVRGGHSRGRLLGEMVLASRWSVMVVRGARRLAQAQAEEETTTLSPQSYRRSRSSVEVVSSCERGEVSEMRKTAVSSDSTSTTAELSTNSLLQLLPAAVLLTHSSALTTLSCPIS